MSRHISSRILLLGILPLMEAQDDSLLVELLKEIRSGDITRRERATEEVFRMGRKALPRLEEIQKDSDIELSVRVKRLIKAIRATDGISQDTLRALPDLQARMADGGSNEWGNVFLDAINWSEDRLPYPLVGRKVLLEIAPLAVAAADRKRIGLVCKYVVKLNLRSAIPAIVHLLRDERSKTILLAMHTLLALDARETSPHIAELLGSPDATIRKGACMTLMGLDARNAADRIAPLARDEDENVRAAAVTALMGLGKGNFNDEYLEALDSAVYDEAVYALVRQGGDASIKNLLSKADSLSETKRLNTILALSKEGVQLVIPSAIELVRGASDHNIRKSALYVLNTLKSRESIPVLMGMAASPDNPIREYVVETLAKLGAREAIPLLGKILTGPKSRGIRDAINALGTLGAIEYVDSIIERADKEPEYRRAAISALGRLNAKKAAPFIVKWLNDDDSISVNAAWALGALGAREHIRDLMPFASKWGEPGLAASAALCRLGANVGFTGLMRLLKDGDDYVRSMAAWEIGQLDQDERVLEEFRPLLKSENRLERLETIAILGRARIRKAVPLLRELLQNADLPTRITAASWLCHLGCDAGVPVLLEECRRLTFLNALRNPETWHRLGPGPLVLRRTSPMPVRDEIYLWTLDTGLTLEWTPPWRGGNWGCEWQFENTPDMLPSGNMFVEKLDRILEDGLFGAILESDKVRILPLNEVCEFWKKWAYGTKCDAPRK